MRERAAQRRKYLVEYEKDEDGMWVAVIDRAQGVSCIAQGRSIGEARKRIRSALGVYLDDPKAAAEAELTDKPKLPTSVRAALAKANDARARAQKAQADAQTASESAASALVGAGVSRRDAADLLGVSHQRVHQFAARALSRGSKKTA